MKGRIYIGTEGISSTVTCNEGQLAAYKLYLANHELFNNPDDFDSDFGLEMGRYEEDWYFAGTGNLDECNGTYDLNGDYGYYITDKYPFTPPCTFGVRDPSFSKESPTLP